MRGVRLGFLLLLSFALGFHQLVVDEDTAASLANNDFLVEADIQLALWRNGAKATTARITLNLYDSQTITHISTDTLESRQQTLIHLSLQHLCLDRKSVV